MHAKIIISKLGELGLEDLNSGFPTYKLGSLFPYKKIKLKPEKEYELSDEGEFFFNDYRCLFASVYSQLPQVK